MIIDIGTSTLEVELNDGLAASQLAAALPLEIAMSRWGDEYYGSLPVTLSSGEKRRDVFGVGEVAYWPPGNAFCIFFGPTPASVGEEPRMASPGIALGRIVSGVAALRSRGAQLKAILRD
ncbi:MAG: cyclophilin-like fold protein [Burkholderiales bacterium]